MASVIDYKNETVYDFYLLIINFSLVFGHHVNIFMKSYFSDFAKIFGCLVGLKSEITAITLVAFGTSQIDLFASKIAAVNDPLADNSIGNVVAANAIGVFLGELTDKF